MIEEDRKFQDTGSAKIRKVVRSQNENTPDQGFGEQNVKYKEGMKDMMRWKLHVHVQRHTLPLQAVGKESFRDTLRR